MCASAPDEDANQQETLEVFQDGDGVWWGKSERARALVKMLCGAEAPEEEEGALGAEL